MSKSKVLVIGGSGFVGKYLCEDLSSRHISFSSYVREKKTDSKLETALGDFNTITDWNAFLSGYDCIIYLVAKVHDMQTQDIIEYRKINVSLTQKIANAAKNSGVKQFIYLSSIKANGEFTTDLPFSESSLPHPIDPYGISKYEAEQELLKIHDDHDFKVTIIRPPLIYGIGVKANFKFLIKLISKVPVLPFGLVNNARSMLYAGNLTDFIIKCIGNPKASGQIFLLSDGKPISLRILCKTLAIESKRPLIMLPVPITILKLLFFVMRKPDYSERLFSNLVIDNSKSTKLLEWTPPYSFQQGIKLMFKADYSSKNVKT